MLLGFKRVFEPFVLDGSKTHTIRAKRKPRVRGALIIEPQPPRVGESCHCYGDTRQKTMHLLGRWPCIRVQSIRILAAPRERGTAWDLSIAIDGENLSHDEAVAFAWRDGFRPVRACDALIVMGHWWAALEREIAFEGHLIHWDYNKPIAQPKGGVQ